MSGEIDIVGTGPELLREGIRSFESVLTEMIAGAEREILLAVYVITPSAHPVLEMLERAAERGVMVTIFINNMEDLKPDVSAYLLNLQQRLKSLFRVVDFQQKKDGVLHTKVVVVDRQTALIGSANLTWGGMVANYELGVRVTGELAWRIAKVLEAVIR